MLISAVELAGLQLPKADDDGGGKETGAMVFGAGKNRADAEL